jgi:hypothetical protein
MRVKDFMQRPIVRALVRALGVFSSVVVVAYVILVFLEMVLASPGFGSPSILPPPTARPVVALIVLCAAVLAYFVTRKHLATDAFSRWSVVGPVALLLIASLFVITSKHNEQKYLAVASADFPRVSAKVLNDDGHEACDWLRGRHWGTPPEIPGRRESKFYGALSHGNYNTAPAPTALVIKSTSRLFIFYTRYLRRQEKARVLTPDEKLKRQVAFVAWYRMCPFQQWVHRPLGGSGSD